MVNPGKYGRLQTFVTKQQVDQSYSCEQVAKGIMFNFNLRIE